MAQIYESATALIGNTPIVEFKNIEKELGLKARVLAKLEYFNPAGSVKDRIAKEMIETAEAEGLLKPGSVIIEPTSGNTGIGLASIAASKGYRLILTMPETMSRERIALLRAYGAEVVVTSFDTELDYHKLCVTCDYVREGLPFVATHPDFNCPTATGFIPDIGSFHALIEASTGRRPDIVVGKPNGEMINYMLNLTGSERERSAVVGDRLYTDVASGVNNGLRGIMVLSGEATLDDLDASPVKPDLIFSSVKEMIPLL